MWLNCLISNGKELHLPKGIAIDTSNRVYVSDGSNCLTTCEGQFVTLFGQYRHQKNLPSNPQGIAVDHSGVVHACDFHNDLLQLY